MLKVTFYSYKGGVGRTLAMLNVAALLAEQGRRVLVVDLDLEAPGLGLSVLTQAHAGQPDPARAGVSDFLLDRWDSIATPMSAYVYPGMMERFGERFQVMTAGTRAGELAGKIEAIFREPQGDAAHIFTLLLAEIEAFIAPDYVFFDSRTGLADVAGVCTMELPDVVVAVCGLNEQNIGGMQGALNQMREHWSAVSREVATLLVLSPVPRQVDLEQRTGKLETIREVVRSRWDDPIELDAALTRHPLGARLHEAQVRLLAPTDGERHLYRFVLKLLDEVLPLGREIVAPGPGERLDEGSPMEPRFLRRLLSEVALFSKMVEVECTRMANGLTLPVLDTVERILCRALEHARRIPQSAFGEHQKPVTDLLRALVTQYIAQAEALLGRLDPLRCVPQGLAVASVSEIVDYPLRALRLGGYLATAGLELLSDAPAPQPERARRIAEVLRDLWQHNEGGFATPVTDDQIIELGLLWELWQRCGMHKEVAEAAGGLLERLLLRKVMALPLPALYLRARVPMRDEHAQTLVEAHLRGRRGAPPAFEDGGSTIALLAVYLAHGGAHIHDARLQALAEPERSTDAARERAGRALYLQAWMPPEDAPTAWYARAIEHRGVVQVFDVSRGVSGLVADFLAFARPLPKTPAEAWGLPVIDRMAWKVWRTPPPMALFVSAAGSSEIAPTVEIPTRATERRR